MSKNLETGPTPRLQVLYLPPLTENGTTRHPYVLVLDNVTAEQAVALTEHGIEHLAHSVGAENVLIFSFPVEVL